MNNLIIEMDSTPAVTGAAKPVRLVKSAERTIEILELLAAAESPLTSTEIQKITGYPRSSLHWLLLTLVQLNWLEFIEDNSSYRVGTRALLCGTSYLDNDPAMQHVPAILERIRNTTTYTTHFARLDKTDVIYLATRQAVDPRRLSSRVGRNLPATATALGKALLAERTTTEIRNLLQNSSFQKLTEHSVGTFEELMTELEQFRTLGYAVEREQNTINVLCVSAVVPYRIPATDALSCSIPLQNATPEEITRVGKMLIESAAELARTLINAGIR